MMEYYAGIIFDAGCTEFQSTPSETAIHAYTFARLGSYKRNHSINFYIKDGERILSIPYSELKFLENSSNLEQRLNDFLEEKLK